MTKEKKESKLDEFKKEYSSLQKKFSLPDFREMNEDFQIEKISEAETEFVVREIRKYVAERFSSYMRFVEALLHPVNASIFIFSVLKSLTEDEKNILKDVYRKMAENEVQLIEVDLEFNEEKEAEYIKDSFKEWQVIKSDMKKVLDKIKKGLGNKIETNSKGYFG